MPTPRPPGVRRADDLKKQIVQRLTPCPRFAPWILVGARASFRSHSLTPLRPDFGSPMLAKTSQAGIRYMQVFGRMFDWDFAPSLAQKTKNTDSAGLNCILKSN